MKATIKERFLNKRGITLVWLALFLFILLIMFASFAIDISFVYFAKNELQVAADAACLAGVAELDGTDNIAQGTARQRAWEFACKNTATGDNVYLVTDNNDPADAQPCNDIDIPAATDLNDSNDASGDIVVGNWDTINRIFDETAIPVNAMRVVARRTGAAPVSDTRIGNNPVDLFLGGIFRLIGFDWSAMDAVGDATCSLEPPIVLPIPICLPSCSLDTPLEAQWGYDKNKEHPIYCTDTPSGANPPGQQFFLESSSQTEPIKKPGLAWTNFDINECGTSPACQNPPNPGEILPFILGTQRPPEICDKWICTTNGTMGGLIGNQNDSPGDPTLRGQFLANKTDIEINGTTINGWRALVPVVRNDSCGVAEQSCPGAQGGKANPYEVEKFASVVITDVLTTGKHGIRLVGTNNPRTETFNFTCVGGVPELPLVRLISSITCTDCNDPLPPEFESIPKLVE